MSLPADVQTLADLCDAKTALAALNSLCDGLFLVDPATGLGRPLNDSAVQMIDDFGEGPAADTAAEWKLLDADVAMRFGLGEGSHLVHWVNRKTKVLCDLHVEFRRLTDAGSAAEFAAPLLAIVRRLGSNSPVNGLPPRDALDDAFHDWLTRLPNRRLFARRLERAIHRAGLSKYHYAVLFVDLDRFKAVNDRYGHLLGDRLLLLVAHRLAEVVRPQDMVARRDGDEFTILLDDLDQADDAAKVAERIVEHFGSPFLVEGIDGVVELTIGASIGVALPGKTATTAEEMILQADRAMYQAKSIGGGTFATLSGPGNKPRPR